MQTLVDEWYVPGWQRSGPQGALLPLQTSAASHCLAGSAGRQTVPAGFPTSVGHALLCPSQTSATSQPPLLSGWQIVPAGFTWSTTGHAGPWPSHMSATSQPAPLSGRQTTFDEA